MKNPGISFLQIEPTTRCNFTCKFCAGRHMPQGDMDSDTFRDVIGSFALIKHIELQGEGEPLLHPHFFELVKIAREYFPDTAISFITNGSLFTSGNIEKILRYKIHKINVSIESLDAQTFRDIRGGNLDKIIDGTRMLIETRNCRNMTHPLIGLAVIILQRTKNEYKDIVSLYNELGLDGGITYQYLQNMEVYTRHYDLEVQQQRLDRAEIKDLEKRVAGDPEVMAVLSSPPKALSFYEEFWQDSAMDMRGCPWLEKALYVNFEGTASSCCYVKDVNKLDFRPVNETNIPRIVKKRQAMLDDLKAGLIPDVCSGCPIAVRILDIKSRGNVDRMER